jgi:hypothetical protein
MVWRLELTVNAKSRAPNATSTARTTRAWRLVHFHGCKLARAKARRHVAFAGFSAATREVVRNTSFETKATARAGFAQVQVEEIRKF